MVAISVQADIERALGKVGKWQQQVPYATSVALNKTAFDVRDAEVQAMRAEFDRPTAFTLNSLYVRPATKQLLEAVVGLKDDVSKGTPAWKYLLPEIKGGDRRVKRFERALQSKGYLPNGMMVVPGVGAKLDAYGNADRAQLVSILAYLQAFGEQGYKANTTQKKRDALRAKGTDYFVINRKRHNIKAFGVYERRTFSAGSAIRPVYVFVRKPVYRSRWDFFGIAQRVVAQRFGLNFEAAWAQAIRTARG